MNKVPPVVFSGPTNEIAPTVYSGESAATTAPSNLFRISYGDMNVAMDPEFATLPYELADRVLRTLRNRFFVPEDYRPTRVRLSDTLALPNICCAIPGDLPDNPDDSVWKLPFPRNLERGVTGPDALARFTLDGIKNIFYGTRFYNQGQIISGTEGVSLPGLRAFIAELPALQPGNSPPSTGQEFTQALAVVATGIFEKITGTPAFPRIICRAE